MPTSQAAQQMKVKVTVYKYIIVLAEVNTLIPTPVNCSTRWLRPPDEPSWLPEASSSSLQHTSIQQLLFQHHHLNELLHYFHFHSNVQPQSLPSWLWQSG